MCKFGFLLLKLRKNKTLNIAIVSGLNVYIKFSDNKVRVSLVLNKAFLARPKTLYSNDPSGLYWRHRTVSSKIGSSSLISSLNSSLVNFSSFHFVLEFQKKKKGLEKVMKYILCGGEHITQLHTSDIVTFDTDITDT